MKFPLKKMRSRSDCWAASWLNLIDFALLRGQWISELKPSGTGSAFWGTAFDHCGYCFDHDSGFVSSNCRKGISFGTSCGFLGASKRFERQNMDPSTWHENSRPIG